jgi:hypothetical protein
MESLEDLYFTIRASPQALGSFLWYREDIIIEAFQAAAFHEKHHLGELPTA